MGFFAPKFPEPTPLPPIPTRADVSKKKPPRRPSREATYTTPGGARGLGDPTFLRRPEAMSGIQGAPAGQLGRGPGMRSARLGDAY